MVTRRLLAGVLALALAAGPAWADSPKLAQARRAVETVDYEAAQRLLLEALREGNHAPAAVGEIYRLSARAAVVLGQRDLAEQYYRRWLAIDPDATLPADTAPKLREPFVAAQAYIAAHGRLLARAQRTPSGEIDVELVADPLAMAHAAVVLDPTESSAPEPPGSPAPFGADRRVHLPAGSRAAILDDSGNRLLDLDAVPAPSTPAPADAAQPATPAPTEPWIRRWSTWAIPTGVSGLVSAGFGIAALASYQRARQIASASGQYFLSDAEANVRRGRTFVWITAGAGAVTLGCAIPTAIFFLRDHERGTVILPVLGGRQIGLSFTGRF